MTTPALLDLGALWAAMAAGKPGGNAERLKVYWTAGPGAAKIRWGVPGDFKRCVRLLREETGGAGLDVEGYCANLHHRALGVWPGREHKGAAEAAAWDEKKHPRGPGGEWAHLGSVLDRLKQMPVGETYNHHGAAEVEKHPGNFYHVSIPPGGQKRVYDTPAGAHRAITTGKHDLGQSSAPIGGPRVEPPQEPGGKLSDFAVSQLKDLHTQYLALLADTRPGTDRYKQIKKRLDELTAQINEATGRKPKAAAALQVPALVTLPGVDIVAAGRWKLASGEQTFTAADLRHAVHASQCPAVGPPVIKIGHLDPRFDGEPAVGRVTNMALTQEGNKITGDLAGMPGWLGAVAASAYPRRSIEGTYDFQCQIGHLHPFVITGLALLGVTPPGVGVLGGLRDVAGLYGIQAAAQSGARWRLEAGGDMTTPVTARAITEMDVRRAYYESPGVAMSLWITELQMDPAQLIVADEANQKVYRVPFHIEAGAITFGDAAEVSVSYADVAAGRASGTAVIYASAAESRAVDAAPEDPGAVEDPEEPEEPPYPVDPLPPEALAAADSSGHGNIDTADAGSLNTAARRYCASQGWAMQDGSYPIRPANLHGEADLDKAIHAVGRGGGSHDAIRAHIIKRASALGKSDAIPDNWGSGGKQKAASAGPGIKIDAAGRHGAFSGEHSHPHAALGHQGGDREHDHSHRHSGDGRHAHVHAAGRTKGGPVEFTDEQMAALRSAFGLEDDEELTPERFVTAAGALREQADARPVMAGGPRPLPQGVIAVEESAWQALNQRVEAGERFRQETRRGERDQVIAAAVRAGKFSTAQVPKWERMWDANPESTRDVLASLRPNVVPTEDIGTPGSDDDLEVNADYRNLFTDEYVAATRRPGA